MNPVPRISYWLASLSVLAVSTVAMVRPVAGQETQDSVRAEMERLTARIDSLEVLLSRLQTRGPEPEGGDAIARLRAAAEAAAGQTARPDTAGEAGAGTQFTGRQRNLQALNPEISVSVDFLGHLNTDDTREDNFIPREFEFSFQSTLDPFSRAKIFASHHSHGPEIVPFASGEEEEEEGGGLEIEEGYAEWIGLPGSFSLKLGKFFQRFGTLNRWHSHALPFQGRSLPHLAFLGEESLSQAGASLTWLVPVHGAGTYDASLELTRSSNENVFGESNGPSVLGHVNGFWEISQASDLDLGVSWLRGRHEDGDQRFDRNLFGAEFAYTWRPPARSLYRGVVVRGGVMLLDGLAQGEDREPGTGSALGAWGLTEVRVAQQWLLGARLDWTENPLDPDMTAWLFSPTVTWWQSEWVRLRLEYDLLGRSISDEREGRLWMQMSFAMGPHKHETY